MAYIIQPLAALLLCCAALLPAAAAAELTDNPARASGHYAQVGAHGAWPVRGSIPPLPPVPAQVMAPIPPSPAWMLPPGRAPMPAVQQRRFAPPLGAVVASTATTSQAGAASPGVETTESVDKEALTAEARAIVGDFFTTLKTALETAVSEDGPASAVEMCQVQAPAIAASMADKSGWDVGRTSQKRRNPNNEPDPWEQRVLANFEARKAAGEEVKSMTYSEVVRVDGEKRFRFMKAIPVGGVCLACHGDAIAPDVAAAIDEAYPTDQATGYQLGDLRGAFTLTKPL